MSDYDMPIPLADIESVLDWVDSFKLTRPTRKINRDFSDAVLLAEILRVHYPKLVEMHNYPPRNSHALKLNNWMTLNRKVLKKLRLNLCLHTMEQLANSAPGFIERVLVMVRDKIQRDEVANKSLKDAEQHMSSGGSYYEACGDEENILVVPVKARVNGVLEVVQQKVVNYAVFLAIKEELKDAKESNEMLKQKVEHLDSLLKLKDLRIEELQKQLDRKQTRRKEVEASQNSLAMPSKSQSLNDTNMANKVSSVKSIESKSRIPIPEETKVSISKTEEATTTQKIEETKTIPSTTESLKYSNPSITEVSVTDNIEENSNVDSIRSDIFKEVEDGFQDVDEFKDNQQITITGEDCVLKEVQGIGQPFKTYKDLTYIN